jgi:hypothetical protein
MQIFYLSVWNTLLSVKHKEKNKLIFMEWVLSSSLPVPKFVFRLRGLFFNDTLFILSLRMLKITYLNTGHPWSSAKLPLSYNNPMNSQLLSPTKYFMMTSIPFLLSS